MGDSVPKSKVKMSEEVAHCVIGKHEDVSSNLQHPYKMLGIVVHTPVTPALQGMKTRIAVACGHQLSTRFSGRTHFKLIRTRMVEKDAQHLQLMCVPAAHALIWRVVEEET